MDSLLCFARKMVNLQRRRGGRPWMVGWSAWIYRVNLPPLPSNSRSMVFSCWWNDPPGHQKEMLGKVWVVRDSRCQNRRAKWPNGELLSWRNHEISISTLQPRASAQQARRIICIQHRRTSLNNSEVCEGPSSLRKAAQRKGGTRSHWCYLSSTACHGPILNLTNSIP